MATNTTKEAVKRKGDAALSTSEYWDERYEKSDGQNATHEWFRSYEALEPFFSKHLFGAYPVEKNPHILHLGSGDSTVPYDLAAQGYKNQLCVDFSKKVIEAMAKRPTPHGGVEWAEADVRDMVHISDSSFEVAFDKGTMDAMIHGSPWDPPEDVHDNTSRYLKEVFRVLKDDGVFLYVTFRQPHFVRPLLSVDGIWNLDMEILSGGESSFDYYGFVLRKNKVTG